MADTLHLWTQIVGKIRMTLTPPANHSWHVTLFVSNRGLRTGLMPHHGGLFELEFDFQDHCLRIAPCDGSGDVMPLAGLSVANFYADLMARLEEMGLGVSIRTMPNEIADAVPFDQDHMHAAYDPDLAYAFWRVLLNTDRVFTAFRNGYLGKASPSHFFWGSFDLAVTRFSGATAPPHPGGFPNMPNAVMRDAYSHEVSSAGFWPGNGASPEPIFYSYAYPTLPGFADAPVSPGGAAWSEALGEFVLPYSALISEPNPDAALMSFLQTTFDAAVRAEGSGWARDPQLWAGV